ncbi:MAG: glycosyltransferase family 2 protein [Paracoccus sp. (in: a-proteobacteria)]|uniref:glycosyltransferase family 2 protein n=1 Tax=Paracoccus sp. TaxID=267 RepID=UPI00391ABC33
MRTIVTTMRNEAPFILEWLAYHRAIGFDFFVIFSNDCEDGTDVMLDRLQQMGLVAHLPNPRRGKRPVQWTALKRAANHSAVKKSEWLFVTDVDEFLNIHAGEGRVDDLLAARPDADGFLIGWRMFGANGRIAFEDVPVTRQFTAAAPAQMLWPWRAVQFKALYRNDGRHPRMGIHRPQRPQNPDASPPVWVDDNGGTAGPVPGTIIPHTRPRYQLAQINHYAVGSVENFLVKSARGKPNHSDDPIDLAYWIDRNFNEVEDRSILRHEAATAEAMAELLSDPDLRRLHDEGVAWRRQRIASLMQQSDPFYLYARIVQTPPSRSLPIEMQSRLLRGLFAMRAAQMEAAKA